MFTVNYFANTDALQRKVDEYFDYCFVQKERQGRLVYEAIVPPTFSGLARYLGFSTRKALIEYVDATNLGFEDIINDAKLRIEDFYEQKLILSKGPSTGIQFALKNNCKWEDNNKTQLTGPDNSPIVFSWGVDEQQITDEDVKEIATPVAIGAPEKKKGRPPKKKEPVIKDAEIIEDAPIYEGKNDDDFAMMGDFKFE